MPGWLTAEELWWTDRRRPQARTHRRPTRFPTCSDLAVDFRVRAAWRTCRKPRGHDLSLESSRRTAADARVVGVPRDSRRHFERRQSCPLPVLRRARHTRSRSWMRYWRGPRAMNEWIDELADLCSRGRAGRAGDGMPAYAVRRRAKTGAKMIVTARETIGTIGGGQLEYQCSRIAVGMLDKRPSAPSVRSFPLGVRRWDSAAAAWSTCCSSRWQTGHSRSWLSRPALRCTVSASRRSSLVTGDMATADPAKVHRDAGRNLRASRPSCWQRRFVHRERWRVRILAGVGQRFTARVRRLFSSRPITVAPDFNIAVFGAGHVGTRGGQRLCRSLDCNLRWVDSRRNACSGTLPAERQGRSRRAEPALEVAALPPGQLSTSS